MTGRRVVYVSGAPGAGKTSLAVPLAAELGYALHVVTTLPVAAMAKYDRPVGLGELVTVDTTASLDVTEIAARVLGF